MRIILTILILVNLMISCHEEKECNDSSKIIQIEGDIIYEKYDKGPIKILVVETISDNCQHSGQEPGDIIGRTEIDQPGSFSLEAKITWKKDRPESVFLMAYNDYDLEDDDWCLHSVDAGKQMIISAKDNQEIIMELEKKECPWGFW